MEIPKKPCFVGKVHPLTTPQIFRPIDHTPNLRARVMVVINMGKNFITKKPSMI